MNQVETKSVVPAAADPGPGWMLITLAALCAIIVLVPTIGITAFLLLHGISPVAVMGQLISGMSMFMLSLVLPSVLLMLMAVVFLIAFALRAAWGPVAVSLLALGWTIAGTVSRLLVPALSLQSGLPPLTWLGTVPSLVAPFVLALGLIGFLTTGERPRAWFSSPGKGRFR